MSDIIALAPGVRVNIEVVKDKLVEFVEILRKQVSTNQFETVTKFNFNHTTLGYELSARPAYKFLGANQVCAWKCKPYVQRPQMKLGSFQVKLFGESVGHIFINVGHVLGETKIAGEDKQVIELLNGIITLANRRQAEKESA